MFQPYIWRGREVAYCLLGDILRKLGGVITSMEWLILSKGSGKQKGTSSRVVGTH